MGAVFRRASLRSSSSEPAIQGRYPTKDEGSKGHCGSELERWFGDVIGDLFEDLSARLRDSSVFVGAVGQCVVVGAGIHRDQAHRAAFLDNNDVCLSGTVVDLQTKFQRKAKQFAVGALGSCIGRSVSLVTRCVYGDIPGGILTRLACLSFFSRSLSLSAIFFWRV
jgi:hypothetical protein